jgi:hypothetical protein
MKTEAKTPVWTVTGKTIRRANIAAGMLLREQQYAESLAKLSEEERQDIEKSLPLWIVGQYKKLEALRGEDADSAELGKETEINVRVKLEEHLGIRRDV